MKNLARHHPVIFGALLVLTILALSIGIYMPEIRDALVFQPQRLRAEESVRMLMASEQALHRKTGHFAAFRLGAQSPPLQAAGLDWGKLANDNFQFDADILPDQGVKLRALPRPEAVTDFRLAGKMYVAEIGPKGNGESRWYP